MAEEYKGDIGLYLSGQPVKIQSCNIYVVQPKIKDIVLMSNENDFMTAAYLLSNIDKFAAMIKEGKSVLNTMSDFQIIIEVLRQQSGQFNILFNNFFELCFPDFVITYSKHSINFVEKGKEENIIGMLNTFNYEDFATTLQELFLPKRKSDPEYHIDESNALSKKLLEKIKKNRAALAKQRALKEGANSSIFGIYISSLSIGLGMDINILYNYTPFQLYDSFNRFIAKMARDKYESLLTIPFADTAKIQENEPPNWLENLYKPVEEEYNSLQGLSNVNSSAR